MTSLELKGNRKWPNPERPDMRCRKRSGISVQNAARGFKPGNSSGEYLSVFDAPKNKRDRLSV